MAKSNTFEKIMQEIANAVSKETGEEFFRVLFFELFHNASDAVFLCEVKDNALGKILQANNVACMHLGYKKQELLEKALHDIIDENSALKLPGVIDKLNDGLSVLMECNFISKGGKELQFEINARKITLDNKEILMSIARNITERKIAEQKLSHMAYHDPLTGLPNRLLFKKRLTYAIETVEKDNKVGVVFFDLDQFKAINDTLGHIAGDELLKAFANRLSEEINPDNLFRMGGDEFTLLLPSVPNVEELEAAAKKIQFTLKDPWIINNREFYLTTSIGIAVYPDDGKDADTLIKKADTAMYSAKEAGGNNYVFYTPSMTKNILNLLKSNTLSAALERNEFLLYYQPKINIQTGKIVGLEALLRWNHPERGILLPGEFIPLAESSGLIIPLGEWVLEQACQQIKKWQEKGFVLPVAVNISARQFHQKDFAASVERILKETEVDPAYLELELTETVAMQDIAFTTRALAKLKKMGINIAIDDFGTGYSSLAYLKKLPINILKIDRSFIQDLTKKENDAAIVSAIIAMAKSLGLEVIAEGVETEQQANFLINQNCSIMQGFLFGRPVPEDKLSGIMKNIPNIGR